MLLLYLSVAYYYDAGLFGSTSSVSSANDLFESSMQLITNVFSNGKLNDT